MMYLDIVVRMIIFQIRELEMIMTELRKKHQIKEKTFAVKPCLQEGRWKFKLSN